MKIDYIEAGLHCLELRLHLPDQVRTVLALWALDLELAPPDNLPADAAFMGDLLRRVAASGHPARILCAELAALHDYAARAGHPAPATDLGAEADQILGWLTQR